MSTSLPVEVIAVDDSVTLQHVSCIGEGSPSATWLAQTGQSARPAYVTAEASAAHQLARADSSGCLQSYSALPVESY